MSGWVEGAAWSKHTRSILTPVLARLRNRYVCILQTSRAHAYRPFMSALLQDKKNRLLMSALVCGSRQIPIPAHLLRPCNLMLCRSMAMLWQAWREEAQYARVKRQGMLQAVLMMRSRLLSSAWAGWRACCADLASGRALAEQIIMAIRQRLFGLPSTVLVSNV